jgi:hypothetical protein
MVGKGRPRGRGGANRDSLASKKSSRPIVPLPPEDREAKKKWNRMVVDGLRESSPLDDGLAKEALLGELLTAMNMNDHFAEVIDNRTITGDEATSKNANTRNVLKIIQALGVDKLRDPDEDEEF